MVLQKCLLLDHVLGHMMPPLHLTVGGPIIAPTHRQSPATASFMSDYCSEPRTTAHTVFCLVQLVRRQLYQILRQASTGQLPQRELSGPAGLGLGLGVFH